jgi:hypothetical protein
MTHMGELQYNATLALRNFANTNPYYAMLVAVDIITRNKVAVDITLLHQLV